jgi:tetratricopeptide (TPR) repeat protein
MEYSSRRVIVLVWSLALITVFSNTALSQPCQQWVGKMVSVQGTVEARKAGDTRWLPVNLNDTFCPGDTIRVGSKSRADLTLSNQSVLRLDENSEFTLEGVKEGGAVSLNMLKGAAHFFSRTPRGLEVQTPYTVAGVRGTEFMVRIEEGRTLLTVYEGAVLAQNPAGSLTLQNGQSAVAEAGKAPVLRTVARPRDAVQWALYYPPVIYTAPGAAALPANDPQLYAQRASQLLAVGRVDEASAEIQRSLSLDPKASDALALQTILLIVQNQKDKALETAERAVSADANSATAHIALSYAQQARFDLEAARTSLEKAVKLDPANALAWARLAEIESSFGRLDKSLEAAKKSVSINPNLSRTQTVLGFAYLTQVETQQAREAFEKAIAFDQADPLPRLGMGLAVIRDGNLEEGGRQIEIAASLDPNNSLIRSYLGKTYYEEKRIGLDQREYATAKELDPKDPTPYFYDAIAKQTTNRPVEALQDYQKAIELNDNRAVYRSQLLLDSDLAARSAALARIYSDLGFQQLGLVEGWKSVNTDPTNYSAHRFLADSYSVRPRHEIARVSELLQSQLLQPINITPIQPRLAESNLFLIGAQGPTNASFNEFNPLFTRNQLTLQASGLAGSNSTLSEELVASGIYNRSSFSIGQYYMDTDGFRKNSQLTDKIYNVFVQQELSYKTSIQAEYRYRDIKNGDIQLRFFGDDFDPNLDNKDNARSGRVGFRHAFAPGSDLIGNFMYGKSDFRTQTAFEPVIPLIDGKANSDAYGAELSYLGRFKFFNVTAGGGYFDVDIQDKIRSDFLLELPPPDPPLLIQDSQQYDRDVHHTNLYLYSNVRLPHDLTLTLGASADFYNADSPDEKDKNQFNPKFGVTWNPLPDTTLRAAAFRTLRRTLITNQTLEPTQVAGFNQFFDQDDATDTWRYGAAVDQKFTKSLFGGVELKYSALNVPYTYVDVVTGDSELKNANWEEKQLRPYLFWTPHEWFSLSAEYIWERLEREKGYAAYAKNATTHSVPLGINFFHPSGLSASFKATYNKQNGSFSRQFDSANFNDGHDDFWLLDASISYRLPKRYGFITVGVANLTDEKFDYFDSDPNNPHIMPDRFFFGRLTLAF